jgi:spermidine synthase
LTLDFEEKLVLAGLAVLAALGFVIDLPPLEGIQGALAATFLLLLTLPVMTLRSGAARALGSLRRSAPTIGALLVYEGVSAVNGNLITRWLGIAPEDSWMMRIDQALLGAELPERFARVASSSAVAAARVLDAWAPLAVVLLTFVIAENLLGDAPFVLRLRRALVLTLFGSLLARLLVPVAGPRFVVEGAHAVLPGATLHRRLFNPDKDRWDAFPALDLALAWIVVDVMWRRSRPVMRALAIAFAIAVVVCAAVSVRHYGADLVAGAAVGAAAVLAADRIPSGARPVVLPALDLLARARRPLLVLGLLFTCTGAAALLSEQAFEKLLGAMLGASTPAAAIVLSVYFVGLTLGAGLYGLASRQIARPLAAYAVLEAGVAAWAMLLCIGYEGLTAWSVPILTRALASPFQLEATRAAIACAWMLPPTVFVGATFPAMVDALEAMRAPSPRRTMSAFYAVNLLGAVAGAVLGPYVTFPRLGVDGTLLIAAAVDGIACIAALLLDLAWKWTRPPSAAPASSLATSHRGEGLLFAAAFVSGFLLFSLEILWTHLLSATIGNSVYSFAAMLGLVLTGLFAGSVLSARTFRADDTTPTWALAATCVLGGLVLALEEPRWPAISGRLAIAGPLIATFGASECLRWFHAGVQILPTATVLGVLYPTLFRLREFRDAGRGGLVGGLAATNAAGCCMGALLTAFVAIPRIGSQRSLDLVAIACSGLGAVLALAFSTGKLRRLLLASAAAAVALTSALPRWDRLALTAGTHVYLKPLFVFPETRLTFFHEDSFGGITTVVDNIEPVGSSLQRYRTLLTNGKFQGNDAGETDAQLGFALLPILHAHGLDRACVIGLGTGQSARVFSDLGFARIDIAEISPGIVAASPYFSAINGGVLGRPNVHLWLEDGRTLLSLHQDLACDVVSMEISSVWFAGSTNLYSKEFYEIASRRVGDAGVLQQWIQLHHIGLEELQTVLATVRVIFPHVTFWVFGAQGIVVASQSPLELTVEGAAHFFEGASALGLDPAHAGELFERALATQLLSESDVTKMASDPAVTINTDRNRRLEFASARHAMDAADVATRNVVALARGAAFRPLDVTPDYPPEARALVERADAKRIRALASSSR